MITPHDIRDLTVAQASAEGRPAYLSAASGLVCVQSWMYVVADDEHHLGVFQKDSQAPGDLFRLIDGELPSGKKDRKKHKPDFEVLLRLPPLEGCPHGALLAAGSASRENRQRGVIVALERSGARQGSPRKIDLSFIFGSLKGRFDALNIEGALVRGSELLLFQRGNKKNNANAIIRFSLPHFVEALNVAHPTPLEPLSVQTLDLGRINEVPFSFTDAAALPNGDIVFSAVAEDTDDSYNDGKCVGAALGLLDVSGEILWLRPLAHPHKIEGIDVQREDNDLKILMVTDADDIAHPAKLLATTTPYGPD